MNDSSRLDDLVQRAERLLEEASAAGLAEPFTAALSSMVQGATRPSAAAAGDESPGRFEMIGISAKMQALYELLEKVIASDVQVLVNGETGTGKELVAKAVHQHGARSQQPFIAENCAAVSAQLLESELFGHKKGSFTGAISDRDGHFVAADKGTVFLDEIGDMPLEMQAKLLRVLQDGELRPVGGNKTISVDVRLVAATNKDLAAMCQTGEFREDLYYRLNVINIVLPPLREREGDVRILAQHFARRISETSGRQVEISEGALALLEAWTWPGNVRELENEVQRGAALASGKIQPKDLSPALQPE